MTLHQQIEKVLDANYDSKMAQHEEMTRQILALIEKKVMGCVPEESKGVDNGIMWEEAWNECRASALSRLHSLFAVEKDDDKLIIGIDFAKP